MSIQEPDKQTPHVDEDRQTSLPWMEYYAELTDTVNDLDSNAGHITGQGVAVADSTGSGDVVAQFNALLASLRTAGIIST